MTFEPPELVTVSGRVWVLPTCTFPKLKLGALAVNEPGVTALPARGTVSVGLEALLVMERPKLSVPAD